MSLTVTEVRLWRLWPGDGDRETRDEGAVGTQLDYHTGHVALWKDGYLWLFETFHDDLVISCCDRATWKVVSAFDGCSHPIHHRRTSWDHTSAVARCSPRRRSPSPIHPVRSAARGSDRPPRRLCCRARTATASTRNVLARCGRRRRPTPPTARPPRCRSSTRTSSSSSRRTQTTTTTHR